MAQQEKHNRKGAGHPKKRKTEKSYYFDEEAALQAIKSGTIQKQRDEEADKIEYDRTHAFENWKRYSEYEEKHFPGRHQARWEMWDFARRHKKDCDSLDLLRNGAVKEQTKEILPHLNDKQLEALLPLFNDYCAKKPFNVEALKDIFNLKSNGLQIQNAKFLAYIFNQLASRNLISDNWQKNFRENKTFVSKSGKPIKLSSELSNFITDITGDGLDAKGKLKPTHNRNKRIAQRINEVIDTLCS